MNGVISWMARNGVASNLLMMLILITGLIGFYNVTIKTFPETELDLIRIQVPYLGASPVEVEESIIRRIEEKIKSVEDIQEITATASEGMASVVVELVLGADTQRRLDEIKSKVDQITTFPIQAEQPQISQLSSQQRAIQIIISGDTSERELKELANRIKDDLTFLPEISIVNISGARDYEVSIEAGVDTLRSYGLTLNDISSVVRRESLELPGGELETPNEEMVLRTVGRNYNKQDFGEIVVASGDNGSRVLLRDMAQIRDDFTDSDLFSFYNDRPAVMVNVMRVGDEQVLDIADAVKKYVEQKLKPSLPIGITAQIARNESVIIHNRLAILLENGFMGLALVIVTLTLFLELRVAFWTSLGILISFVGVFGTMVYTGATINVLSSVAFLLSIGIVVDDAIVVGENIFSRMESGTSPLQAAIQGAQRISVPVIFAVATTIATFAALLNLPGTLGALLADIPRVVIGVLLLSVAEALLILPYHLSQTGHNWDNKFTRPITALQRKISVAFDKFTNGPLDRTLRFVTGHPWVTICGSIALLLFCIGILLGGYVKFNFFPQIEGEYVTASIELPTGATTERSEAIVRRLEAALLTTADQMSEELYDGEPIIESLHLLIGTLDSGAPTPIGISSGRGAANLATIAVEIVPPEIRDFPTSELARRWRAAVGNVPEVRKLTFSSDEVTFGDPIRVELSMSDERRLPDVIEAVESQLRAIDGVFDVRNDRDTGKREITFSLKPEARTLGLTLESLAFQIRAAFFGDEALRVQRGREDVRVYVRLPKDERDSLADLNNYRIRTPQGFVPLSEVAELDEGLSPSAIHRRNGRRVIAVSANLDFNSITSGQVNSIISSSIMPPLLAKYPGLSYDFGGEQRETERTGSAMAAYFALALLAIYSMLAIAFRSYIEPLIVMVVIPFGIFGAVMGHLLFGTDLSILSIFGIIGLSGVVVNGALVMIDFINEERRSGITGIPAIIQGAKYRFRPIFLTSLTTFLGVGPLIFETSLQAQFLIPVALSVGFGVLFGTVIQMLLVPALMTIHGAAAIETELSRSGLVTGEA